MKADSLEYLTVRRQYEGFEFFFSPQCPEQDKIMALASGKLEPEAYLRQGRRRNVLRMGGIIMKLYFFHSLSDIIHSRRYGHREVECHHDYLKAFGNEKGFRLPQLLGYFEKPLLGPFQAANGIICDYIPNARMLEQSEITRAVPLFAHLYRKGIYHPDMNYGNILYQAQDDLIVPLDYMGCNFLSAPNWEVLLIEASRFLSTGKIDEKNCMAFLAKLLELLPDVPLTPEKAWEGIKLIKELHPTTHQYRHPVFLPKSIRDSLLRT